MEFLKNREDIIQRFFDQVTSKVPKDFSADIVNKMKSFLDKHKVILKDYLFLEPAIEKHQDELEKLLDKLNSEVDKKKEEHNDIIFKDKFLDFLASCSKCDELNAEELELIKKHFTILAKDLSGEKIDSIIKKPNGSFPGLGDIKEKPEDPYGDYIIYHEMLKYMAINETNAVFLTFDNSKGDWMSKNKTPHLHYIQNTFNNTGKILYIIDAERALGELLNININSLVKENNDYSQSLISAESLLNYALKSELFEGAAIVDFPDNFLEELRLNGYTKIEDIANDLDKEKAGILKYRKDNPKLNVIGVLRTGLRIANPNCVLSVSSKDGEIKTITKTSKMRYKRYRKVMDDIEE